LIDIKILKKDTDGTLTMASGYSPFKVSGIDKLVQHVVKVLLTTPGSDLWNPGMGGGLQSIVSRNVHDQNSSTISGEIGIAVINTERYILQEQIGLNLTDDESLKELTMIKCYFDSSNSRWDVVLRLITKSNKINIFNLA